MRAQLKALATEIAAAMARLAIATSAAAKEDRRSPDGNGGAGAGWPIPWEQLGDWRARDVQTERGRHGSDSQTFLPPERPADVPLC